MLIKVSELSVPEENPFMYDSLQRIESAEILTQLISTLDQPFVISIDSKWGSGKTTFIRMWRQYLRNNGYTDVYFNAWENDISNDALSALVAEIKKAIDVAPDIGKAKEFFETLKDVTTRILKRSIPVAIKIGTAGLLDASDFVEDAVSSATEKFINDSIDNYEKRQEDIQNFKEQLGDFAQSLYQDGKGPLVFFIDELDRCRPNFALEILEKAKHLFSVKNIVFVISIDRKQLGNSIKAIYGNDFDTNEYLRRFIDLDYNLPDPNIETFCNLLMDRFLFNEYFRERTHSELRYDGKHFIETTVVLFKLLGCSLRTIEQFFSQMSIVLRTIPKDHHMFPILLVFMVIMKNNNPDLYVSLKLKQCTEKDIIDYLYSIDPSGTFLTKNHLGAILEAHVFYLSATYLNYEKARSLVNSNYSVRLKDSTITTEEKQRLETILRMIEQLDWASYGILDNLIKKIDISQRFI